MATKKKGVEGPKRSTPVSRRRSPSGAEGPKRSQKRTMQSRLESLQSKTRRTAGVSNPLNRAKATQRGVEGPKKSEYSAVYDWGGFREGYGWYGSPGAKKPKDKTLLEWKEFRGADRRSKRPANPSRPRSEGPKRSVPVAKKITRSRPVKKK